MADTANLKTMTADFAAVRVGAGARSVVVVTHPDGTVRRLGGARAERAAAVVVVSYAPGKFDYRCRSDAAQARSEAARAAEPHVIRCGGAPFNVPAALVAVRVLVTEATP